MRILIVVALTTCLLYCAGRVAGDDERDAGAGPVDACECVRRVVYAGVFEPDENGDHSLRIDGWDPASPPNIKVWSRYPEEYADGPYWHKHGFRVYDDGTVVIPVGGIYGAGQPFRVVVVR